MDEEDQVIAIDNGILVKTDMQIMISVRKAIAGKDLKTLHETIKQEFMQENIQEKTNTFIIS